MDFDSQIESNSTRVSCSKQSGHIENHHGWMGRDRPTFEIKPNEPDWEMKMKVKLKEVNQKPEKMNGF